MKSALSFSARALALIWAGFWMFFFIAESQETGAPRGSAFLWMGLGLLFFVLAFLPWRWETLGGVLLIAAALLVGTAYSIWAPSHLTAGVKLLTTATFAIPPLLAGILFLLHRWMLSRHA